MECIILIRMNNGSVTALMDEGGENIALFSDMDAAVVVTQKHPLCQAMPWQIVELTEL